jgi:hypothetical protein
MKPVHLAAFAVLATFTVGADSGARFRAELTGLEEVPANFSSATGFFSARAVDGDTAIEYELSYAGFATDVMAAHVHFGQPNVNGGVSFFLCGGGGKAACPLRSGTVTGRVIASDVRGPENQGILPGDLDAILQMMRQGFAYANAHSMRSPNGEIRGQIKAIGAAE